MNYETIYLLRKEKRRFLEIANGDTEASNTPEEDALFRKGLVKETMLGKFCLDTGYSTADERAVVLSDMGKDYFAQCRNQQKKDKRDAWQFWLTTLIAVVGLIIAFLELLG